MPTLLVADDSVTIQRVIELTFADEDIQVVAVNDGAQAVAALDQAPPPDIVLADVGMPGRSGYEVAQYIRDTPRLAHIPVLLLTGAFEPVDQAQAAAVGCDGVLAKPFEPQFLIGRVKELLATPKGTAVLSDASSTLDEGVGSYSTSTPVAEYFDRLDQAFADLSGAPEAADRWDRGAREALADESPSLGAHPGSSEPSAWGSDLLDAASASARDASPPGAPATAARPEATAAVPVLPPLGDAFASLLVAEQSAPPASAPAWPAAPSPGPVASDTAIEEISRRVLETLTDRVIRDTVGEIVSEVAERLVRGEIEKIKSAID